MTRSVHKAVNRFITTLRSTSSINSSSDTGTFEIQDTSISGFTLPTGNCRIYMVLEFGQIAKEEIFRITNITGNVCTYNLRIPVNGYVKPSHSGGASVRINDVADIINDISNHIDTFGYVERITGTQTINVDGGNYNGNGVTYVVANQTFAIAGGQLVDNTTNYVYFNLTTNLFTVTQTATLTAAIQMASVVCAGGSITSIVDKRPAFFTTYGEIAAKLDKAAGVRDTIGLNKTIVVDRTTGTEVIKNVDDATTLDLTTTLRLRKASGDYSDAPVTLLKNAIDSNLHPIPVISTMTAPIAVDTFNTQLISSNAAVDSADRLTETFVSSGSGVDVAMTYVFTASKNVFLNSATYPGTRNIGYTVTLKETVSLAVLYTGAGNATATDTFGTGVFLRKGVSYTVETRWTGSATYTYTFPSGDLTLTSLTTGSRNPESLTFNYTVANNIPFGITTVSNVQTPVSAVGGSISQIQIALRKVGTPPQVVNVELLNSAGTVITGATATIASGTVTTSQANYNVTLGTPYTASANEKLFVKVSTTGSDNSNYYMIYGSTELSTSGINSSTNADANTLFYASITSTGLNQYVGVPCHPTRSKYAGLCDTTVTNFGLGYLRTAGYSSSTTGLAVDTTYYVNADNSGAITTSSGSGVSIGRTYANNLIVKMP